MKSLLIILQLIFLSYFIPLSAQEKTTEQEAGGQSQDTLLSITELLQKNSPVFLSLEKPGKIKRLRYYVGQTLEFGLKGDPAKYKDVIQAIDTNSITVRETEIPLDQIDYVVMHRDKHFLRTLRKFFFIGGVGYVLIDLFNNPFPPPAETAVVSTSFVIPGIFLIFFIKKRKLKLNGKRYLKTIHHY